MLFFGLRRASVRGKAGNNCQEEDAAADSAMRLFVDATDVHDGADVVDH